MVVSIRDVAKAAEVSETTVSLSFRPESRIGKATRQKVLTVAAEMGYQPNLAAQDLRCGKSSLLGLLVADITNPFYANIARCAQCAAQEAGYRLLLTESQWSREEEREALLRMLRARPAGILACYCDPESDNWRLPQEQGIPQVALDVVPDGYRGARVRNDLHAAGMLAGKHLLQIGCRCPALCIPGGSSPRFGAFRELREGFLAALQEGGGGLPNSRIVDAALTIEGGLEGYRLLQDACPHADGILCGNDLCAFGVLEAVDCSGRGTGGGLAVMGLDDLPASGLSRIGLTSIRQPVRALAQRAAQMLTELVAGADTAGGEVSFSPQLVVRASTAHFSPQA